MVEWHRASVRADRARPSGDCDVDVALFLKVASGQRLVGHTDQVSSESGATAEGGDDGREEEHEEQHRTPRASRLGGVGVHWPNDELSPR